MSPRTDLYRETASTVLALSLALAPGLLSAAPCPLSESTLTRFPTMTKAGGPVLLRSGLNVNADGAPNAYHRVLGPAVADPGTLHICNGVTVLELRDGKMQNRYPQIGGSDLVASRKASAACKADAFKLQEAGFPDCASGTCLRIYGFYAAPRACGAGSGDMSCGVPLAAVGADGKPTGYWVSTLSWSDAKKPLNDPSRYPDPRYIPHFVLPGGEAGEFAKAYGIKLGDIALVAWKGRAAFAAFADAGPKDRIGEASPALINRLRGKPDSATAIGNAIASSDPVATLLLPGSHQLHGGGLPADAAALYRSGMQALSQVGGLEPYASCPGLTGTLEIATQ
jgi:hypothetical protein